jgi:hypothetical protein
LTQIEDRLVAISGVAKWFQGQNGDEYLAGMWRKDLETQVCWHVKPNEDLAVPKPAKYIVPSWSWASVNRSIFRKSYGYDNWPRHLTIVTRVLSFNTIPKSRDGALGQLKGGLLRMIFSKIACGRLEYKYPQQVKIKATDDRNILFFNEDKLDVNWDFPVTNEYRKRVSLLPIILKKGFYVIDSIEGIVLEELCWILKEGIPTHWTLPTLAFQ